ncbi:hypothetical protein DSL92_04560 [Billgrantia gudaonensis]|uniref:Uncharacterized protein n=1 Tax=Billgrantia gudaonensis TaxID=376427 RepID=A0A3S0NHF5_9GAMM|nr:hypothetical protein DSL92_04560 [Halomonas gudaonensis]
MERRVVRSVAVWGRRDRVTLPVPEARLRRRAFRSRAFYRQRYLFSVGADLDASPAYAHIEDMQSLARLGNLPWAACVGARRLVRRE